MGFGRFLQLLYARFALIATITAGAIALAIAVTLAMPTRYYAEASAVLEQPLSDNPALASGGASGISYFLATQRDVVASRAVTERVIDGLQLERDPAGTRRRMGGGNVLLAAVGAVRGWIAGLLQGRRAPQSVREWLVENLQRQLNVSAGRDSRLLKVGFKAGDAEFAAQVANAFMHAFLEVNVKLKAAPARTETVWLEGQMKALREELQTAEARLAAFQQEKGIVATDERLDYENLRLTDLSTQLASAQSERYAAEARRKQLHAYAAGRGRSRSAPAEVLTSPVVVQLRQDIAQREALLKDMSRRLGPNHPRFRAATGELAQLRGQLGAEMRSVAEGLAVAGDVSGEREAGLRAEIDQQKSRILALKKDREQLSMLVRDVDDAQKAYGAAVQRISQAKIESANERPNASVVDEAAVPLRPSSPIVALNLALGAALGALLGLGAALQLEATQRLVRSGDDLTGILGVPVLAVLPARALRAPPRGALSARVVALPRP